MSAHSVNVFQNIFHEDMSSNASESLELNSIVHWKPLLFGFPETSDPLFTGRTDSANQLLQLLNKSNRVLITGTGGIGKSSLATYCASEWTRNDNFSYAAFLNMETEETAKESFKRFSNRIGFSIDEMSYERIKEIFDHLVEELKSKKILLIFDNIKNVDINKYLPNKSRKNIFVLATSKSVELSKLFVCHKLEALSEANCIQLVLNVLKLSGKNFKDEIIDIKKLVQSLEYVPLTIRQAASFIKDEVAYGNPTFSIKDYIKIFDTNCLNKNPSTEHYNKTTYTVLNLNINKVLTNKCAEKIIHCLAFMNPSYVNVELFLNFGDFKKQQYYEAERQLKKYSIITVENDQYGRHIKIHSTFLYIIRSDMNSNTRDEILSLVFKIILSSGNIGIHHEFLLPYMNVKHITEGYSQVFSSGRFQQRLEEQLATVGCSKNEIKDWNVLHYAFYNRNTLIIKKLLKENSIKQLYCVVEGWTILHAIVLTGMDFEQLKFIPMTVREYFMLLFKKIVNSRTNSGYTAIYMSVSLNSEEITDALLDMGSNVNITDKQGNSLLHLTASMSETDLFAKLILFGGNINLCNNDGNTPTHIAALKGDKDLIQLLMSNFADFNIHNKSGYNPVHLAAYNKHTNLTEYMIETQANYNVGDDEFLANTDLSFSMLLKDGHHKRIYTFLTNQIWFTIKYTHKSMNISKCIVLRKLTKQTDGFILLQRCTKEPYENLLGIVYLFNNIPLALTISAAYILNEGISAKEFSEFIVNAPDPLKHTKFMKSCSNTICSSTVKLMCFILSKIKKKHQLAYKILCYASYMNLDNICPQRLSDYLEISLEKVSEEIQILIYYAVLEKIHKSKEQYRLHKLIASIVHLNVDSTMCKRILYVEFTTYFYPEIDSVVDFLQDEDISSVYQDVCENSNQGQVLLERLKKVGCLINNTHNWSPLHYAAADDILAARQVISCLILRGTNMNISANGLTPLHVAAASGNDWAVIRLLLAGAEVDVKINGSTPLHLAVVPTYEVYETVRALIRAGANKKSTDNNGCTPLQLATISGNTHLIGLLSDIIKK